MTAPTPYLHFAGTARDALGFYAEVFGGELTLHTFADFGRDDGPGAAIAHGVLTGPISLYAADAVDTQLLEAARVDGAGELRIFFTVAMRLRLKLSA